MKDIHLQIPMAPVHWNFTGRIKYIKFKKWCRVQFEIEYLVEPLMYDWLLMCDWDWIKRCWKEKRISFFFADTEYKWISESDLCIIQKPEITIYNCKEA